MAEILREPTVNERTANFSAVLAGLSFAAILELSGRTPLTFSTAIAFRAFMVAALVNTYMAASWHVIPGLELLHRERQIGAFMIGLGAFFIGFLALLRSLDYISFWIGSLIFLIAVTVTGRAILRLPRRTK